MPLPSMKISVDLSGFIKGDKTEKQDRIIREEVSRSIVRAELLALPSVVEKTPVNFGTLRGSIAYIPYGQIYIQPGPRFKGKVYTPLIYGPPVESGSKPHSPPVGPLILWARRKFGAEEKEAKSIGYAIRTKISQEGTKGKFMFRKTYREKKAQIKYVLGRAAAFIVRRWDEGG